VNTTNLTDFGTTLYAGFFTYAGPSSNPNVHWASFDNVSLTGSLLGPPGVTVTPQTETAYTGQTVTFTAAPSGNAPFAYQWQSNSVTLANGTNATFTLTNVQPTASGLYTVGLSNSNGTASATATLTVLTPAPGVAQVLSSSPVGYWRLNETAGPTAYDSAGNFNGTGEGGLAFGVQGAGAPFSGFEAGNLAAQFNGSDSDVAIPPLNLNTNAITITGWVKRSGTQTGWSGLLFCRSGTTTSGLHFGTANELRYTWNNSASTYNWNSGLTVPDGVWTFMALVIQPSQAIMYMATNGTLYSATNVVANAVQAFAGTTYLGYDPNSSARRLNGTLDEAAVFNQALTYAQLNQILTASRTVAPAVSLSSPVSGANYGSPATINLAANVTTNGHSITQVQFYSGATLLGQSSTPPYTYSWKNVSAGSYTLLAQVVYDGGVIACSPPAFVTVTPIPAPPTTVTPTALANNLIGVTWPAMANATGYQLSRDGLPIAALSGTNYLDLGLSPSTVYCYAVIATNSFGASNPSATNCATTTSSGAALEWDAGGANAGAQDGNGTWGSGGATWWNGLANVVWAGSSLAIFGAGTTTNCAVTITNDVTPGGLLFNANNGGAYTIMSTTGGLNLSGTPTLTANDNVTINAYLKGNGLIKAGPGTLTLTGGNTNTGTITVNGGRVVATGGGWYGNRSIGSGSLTVGSGATAEFTLAHGFGVDPSGRSATINGGTLQFDLENYVSGLTLNGGSLVGGGQFRAVGATYNVTASANSSVISTPIYLYGNATFNVADGSAPVDLLLSGNVNLTGTFTLNKSGAGLMRCTGNITNSGSTISGGTLQVDGRLGTNTLIIANTATLAGVGVIGATTTIQSGGSLAPGDSGIGTLSCSNNVTFNAGSKAVMEISKPGASLTNDLLTVNGTLTYGGSLIVTNIGTNALVLSNSFKLFNATGYAGAFASYTLPALNAGLGWDTSKLAVNGTIAVGGAPVITTQPQDQVIYVGSNAVFNVAASGTPAPGYQWQFAGTNLPGATLATLTVFGAQPANEGAYSVLVTNVAGSTNSSVAMLSLYREFASAPAPYPSLLASNGARHLIVPGYQLGATNVASTDARTTNTSEDGVTFLGALQAGQGSSVRVVASGAGYLNAWIDYTAEGSWAAPFDQVFTNAALIAGTNALNFTVPAGATATPGTWARFRFSSVTDLTSTSEAPDGEVEDYQVAILSASNPPPAITSAGFNGAGDFVISGQGAPNQSHILQAASNLVAPVTWLPIATNTADNSGGFALTDTQAATFTQRFYRVTLP
jgi:autotransporter-associated beta strand protein